MTDARPEVLLVCIHNAGPSQMAAALLAHYRGDRRVRDLLVELGVASSPA